MAAATCKTCPFYRVNQDGLGRCYLLPAQNVDGEWGNPVMLPSEVCGEHPLHPAQRGRLAAMAMQGILANPTLRPARPDAREPLTPADLAESSLAIADALIAAFAKAEGK
jgi:hypothetical protein